MCVTKWSIQILVSIQELLMFWTIILDHHIVVEYGYLDIHIPIHFERIKNREDGVVYIRDMIGDLIKIKIRRENKVLNVFEKLEVSRCLLFFVQKKKKILVIF